jgi:hypothetical protein
MDDSDDDELDSRSLHVSDLDQSESSQLDLSAISHDPEDEHEILEEIHELEPPEDTMINASSQNKSAFTDPESFRTISQFPSSVESNSNVSSLHLSDLNSSADTTKDESRGGGKRRRKTKKRTKTKKTNNSKKVRKNKVTKKAKKKQTKRRRSITLRRKKRLRGGFIGDNGTDMESYGGTNPYSVERDSDSRF